ncbi:putative transcriptional regulator [Zopfia rhizophila CBS 207.26]|uniref:Putative transcriptional regulator n=1 Tax=Zopfia rhizophila CBS 207.26 TaxID=1314779 RepID=A0A6A6DGX7_9PEZI|nr:putative transcriptional regulator [Zopfia rhizophila CBS 207.26]
MYLRAAHAELRIPALLEFIRENPLGILTTAIHSPNFPLLQCSHIPWVLDTLDASNLEDPGESNESQQIYGRLRGHMARANPHSKALIEYYNSHQKAQNDIAADPVQLKEEVMVLFNHPLHHYITPKFYTTTKPTTGKVVPTWNYAAVQVYGNLTLYCSPSPETHAFLSKQIHDLSHQSETQTMGYERPWQVSDAPDRYVELLKKSIIGVEVEVRRIEGKFKMSQELGEKDREGVVAGFNNLGTDAGKEMADLVRERAEIKAAQKEAKS